MFIGTPNDRHLAGRLYTDAPAGTSSTSPYTTAVPHTPSQVGLMRLGGLASWAAVSVWDQDIATWWATTDDFLSMRRIVQELMGLPDLVSQAERHRQIPATTADELRILYPECPIRTDGRCSVCGSEGWCAPTCSRWIHTTAHTETARHAFLHSRTPLPLARRIIADPDGFRAAVMAAASAPGSALAGEVEWMRRTVRADYAPPVDDMILCARMALRQAGETA